MLQLLIIILIFSVASLVMKAYNHFAYKHKFKIIMATLQEFQTILTRIDKATTNIAEDLRGLKDQISGQGLPSDVEEEILAQLEAKAVALESIAGETPEDEEGEEEPIEDVE